MVFNTTFNNISVISWMEFNWTPTSLVKITLFRLSIYFHEISLLNCVYTSISTMAKMTALYEDNLILITVSNKGHRPDRKNYNSSITNDCLLLDKSLINNLYAFCLYRTAMLASNHFFFL